jgi:hypothetical protein
MVRVGYCILLACALVMTLNSTSFGQSNPIRTRDRQSRIRNTVNRPGSSRSTGQFPAKNLPAEFAILNTRTIFSKEGRAARVDSQTRVRPTSDSRPTSPIFRGVINEVGGNRLAGIERGTSTITWYHENQSVGNGDRITEISLDQITITLRNGDRRSVAVGERLDAGTAVSRGSARPEPVTQPSDVRFTLRDDSDTGE